LPVTCFQQTISEHEYFYWNDFRYESSAITCTRPMRASDGLEDDAGEDEQAWMWSSMVSCEEGGWSLSAVGGDDGDLRDARRLCADAT